MHLGASQIRSSVPRKPVGDDSSDGPTKRQMELKQVRDMQKLIARHIMKKNPSRPGSSQAVFNRDLKQAMTSRNSESTTIQHRSAHLKLIPTKQRSRVKEFLSRYKQEHEQTPTH